MICRACATAADTQQPHTDCRGESWCECQHQEPRPRPPWEQPAEAVPGDE